MLHPASKKAIEASESASRVVVCFMGILLRRGLDKFADVFPGFTLTIDLERQVIVKPQGEEMALPVEVFRKYCLINGLDDIGPTLRNSDKIKAFEAERLAKKPWLANIWSERGAP